MELKSLFITHDGITHRGVECETCEVCIEIRKQRAEAFDDIFSDKPQEIKTIVRSDNVCISCEG